MTVSNQTNRVSAVGTAAIGQTVAINFPYADTSDLKVYSRVTATGVETDLVETTNYTLTDGRDTGGTLTTVTAVAATATIHIIRDTPTTQVLDLEQGGSFNAENIEDALDKNTKLSIENSDALARTLIFPATDPTSSFAEMPNSVDRASKNLTFDSSGKPTASVVVEEGTVSFTTFGENMVGAANVLAGKTAINLDHVIDVRDYDAVGDGTTDDTAEIQAAIDALPANGGIVFLPEGRYLVSSPLVLTRGCVLQGVSTPATIIDFAAGTDDCIIDARLATSNRYIRIRDMTILGGGKDTFLGSAIYFRNVLFGSIERVAIDEVDTGITFDGADSKVCYYNVISDCSIGSSADFIKTGVYFKGDATSGANKNYIVRGQIAGTETVAVHIDLSSDATIKETSIEDNLGKGIVTSGLRTQITNTRFENSDASFDIAIDIEAAARLTQIGPGNSYHTSSDRIVDAGTATNMLDHSHDSVLGSPSFASIDGVEQLIKNGDFRYWVAGTAVAPTNWTLIGAGAAVAREDTIIKGGLYSAKITYGSASANLYQGITIDDYYDNRKVTVSAWVYTTVADKVRIQIPTGAGTYSSSYHTGGGGWEKLVTSAVVPAGATLLRINFVIEAAGSAYIDGVMFVEGNTARPFSSHNLDFLTDSSNINTLVDYIITADGAVVVYEGNIVINVV